MSKPTCATCKTPLGEKRTELRRFTNLVAAFCSVECANAAIVTFKVVTDAADKTKAPTAPR